MEDIKSPFRKIDGKVVYLGSVCSNNGWGPGLVLANPTTTTNYLPIGFSYKESVEVPDKDLIRLWPHRTRAIRNGRNAMEEKISNELVGRGYGLTLIKGNWKKVI